MKHGDNFQYEYFSAVTQLKVEWLRYPYIPYGKLTIMQSAKKELGVNLYRKEGTRLRYPEDQSGT